MWTLMVMIIINYSSCINHDDINKTDGLIEIYKFHLIIIIYFDPLNYIFFVEYSRCQFARMEGNHKFLPTIPTFM